MPAASLAQKTAEKSGGISIRYEGEVNVGFGLGGKLKMDGQSADAKYSRPFIETIHGVRIARYAFVGLGVGFQYAYDDWKVGMMPLFVDLKGCYPVTENFAPYIAVDLGFGMGVTGTKNFGSKLYFVGYFYNLTHSISYRLRIYISHPQQTCTKIAIKKSNEGGARAYWQVGFEIIDVFLFRLPSHLSLVWSCFLSNICPRISSCFGLIIWHKAVMFDIFSNRR